MILPPATATGTQIVSYDVTWRDDILDQMIILKMWRKQ